ncbi:MAG: hypothetical protein JXA83_09850, partial [Acidimicrobiales bacterium]|nr:hypothetical protein [Acidimicrobiales bacterium]
ALTRCTSRLVIVHARPLPDVLGLDPGAPGVEAGGGSPSDGELPATGPEGAEAGTETTVMPAPVPAVESVIEGHGQTDPAADGEVVVDGGGRMDGEVGEHAVGGPAVRDESPAAAEVVAAVAGLDLDHEIARAIAATVVEKLAHVVAPAMLPLVGEEIARSLARRTTAMVEPEPDDGPAMRGSARPGEHGRASNR